MPVCWHDLLRRQNMEPITKPFWMSKTLWFNVLSIIILVIEYFIANEMFPTLLQWESLAIIVINAVIRLFFTETKLEK